MKQVKCADFNNDGDIDIVAVGQGSPWDIAYYYRISLGGTSSEVKEGWLYIFN